MAFSDYSTTPGSNTTIGGVNVGEGCPPGNLNNAIRQIAADGRQLSDQVSGQGGAMPRTGGAFTGEITRQGQGGYLRFIDSGLTDARVYVLPTGSARPAPTEGTVVFYY